MLVSTRHNYLYIYITVSLFCSLSDLWGKLDEFQHKLYNNLIFMSSFYHVTIHVTIWVHYTNFSLETVFLFSIMLFTNSLNGRTHQRFIISKKPWGKKGYRKKKFTKYLSKEFFFELRLGPEIMLNKKNICWNCSFSILNYCKYTQLTHIQ